MLKYFVEGRRPARFRDELLEIGVDLIGGKRIGCI
jgi:hypothetical protein